MCKSVRALKIVLLTVATIGLALTIAVNYISSAAVQFGRTIGLLNEWNTTVTWTSRGVFQNSTITPTGWTFGVWLVIYVYQVLWLAYCWTTVCRRAYPDGPFLCCEPDLAPNGLLLWFFISSLANMAWILLADRIDYQEFLLIPQTCIIFAIVLSLGVSLASSYYTLRRDRRIIENCERRLDYWLTVVLVQNGLSLYAGWTTVASFINLDLVLIYMTEVKSETSSVIALGILIAIVFIYALCDLTVMDKLTRFVFTPHLVIIWAGAGSMAKNFTPWNVNTILTLTVICLAGAGLLLKFICICARSRRDPILSSQSYQLKNM